MSGTSILRAVALRCSQITQVAVVAVAVAAVGVADIANGSQSASIGHNT